MANDDELIKKLERRQKAFGGIKPTETPEETKKRKKEAAPEPAPEPKKEYSRGGLFGIKW